MCADEEIGGIHGMKVFAPTDVFKSLNIGFSLDEGNYYELCN